MLECSHRTNLNIARFRAQRAEQGQIQNFSNYNTVFFYIKCSNVSEVGRKSFKYTIRSWSIRSLVEALSYCFWMTIKLHSKHNHLSLSSVFQWFLKSNLVFNRSTELCTEGPAILSPLKTLVQFKRISMKMNYCRNFVPMIVNVLFMSASSLISTEGKDQKYVAGDICRKLLLRTAAK